MSEVTSIVQAIVQFGFPAVWSVLILWYCTKQTDAHREETSSLKDAINNNTQTINELKIMIQMMTNNKKEDT